MVKGSVKARKALAVAAILAFFLGFPVIGLMYFWNDMHHKIQANASEPVQELADMSMRTWDDEFIGRRLGPEVKPEEMDRKVAELKAKFGNLQTLSPGGHPKSWAREYKDQAWQFARFDFPAKFEKGEAVIRFTGTRLYLEKEWKIHDIEVLP